jgi:phospholipid transport system substrate-binding protein
MKKRIVATLGGASLIMMTMGWSSLSIAQNYGEEYMDNAQAAYSQAPAGYYTDYSQPAPPPQPSPVDLLEDSIHQVVQFISTPNEASLDQITYFLQNEIAPHFDFNYMARSVAGRYYRTMTPEQRHAFTENFAELFITTFVQKLSNYQAYPPMIDNFVSRRTGETEAEASANIIQEDGLVIPVDFRFVRTPKGWKVVDVKANGVSALMYYRNYFAAEIRKQQYAAAYR